MARYPLNLPVELKREAEDLAAKQGISLNQFILWSVAEKVADLRQGLDDPRFAHIVYRRGAAGVPTPVLRGTGIRVQTIAIDAQHWGMTREAIAEQYDLEQALVDEAMAFYEAHRIEIDLQIQAEKAIEARYG
jgi:uncharacterized protein (DUF433 family)